MTAKQLKPLPPTAAPRPRAPAVVKPGQPWAKPDVPLSDVPESASDIVRKNLNDILMRCVTESLEDIGKSLKPTPLSGLQLRMTLKTDREIRKRYEAVLEHKADHMFELGIDAAIKCKASGDYGRASALFQQLAATMAPKVYGAKAELKIIGKLDVEVEGKVTMTADEAYMKMVKGE